MAANKRTTLKDVAYRAGVSSVTVSYVLNGRKNGPDRISPETRQRVLAAAEYLNYVPNVSARTLRRSTTERICLSLPRIGVPKYDQLASALQDAAEDRGFQLILTISRDTDGEIRVVRQMQSGLADGMVMLLEREVDQSLTEPLETLGKSGAAVVALGNLLQGDYFDVVANTSFEAIQDAVTHLINQGHKCIALLPLKVGKNTFHSRYKIYMETFEACGLPTNKVLVTNGAATREEAYQQTADILRATSRPTAIIACTDVAALSAIHAVRDAGLRVPTDVAVVGAGDILEGELSSPALTTIGPISRSVNDVIDLLFSRLTTDEPIAGRYLVRQWELKIRESA
jgi:DNA-binding LacI/PurR family transcriptional regulator